MSSEEEEEEVVVVVASLLNGGYTLASLAKRGGELRPFLPRPTT